jgi:hypothetical protein
MHLLTAEALGNKKLRCIADLRIWGRDNPKAYGLARGDSASSRRMQEAASQGMDLDPLDAAIAG